ncbi:NUDIX hydrolase [Chelativorans composti]|jgi:ADP-ribose pyrophosphatase|uniref:NUDIX hydrolase n=1 Tax=Chelativorans composti TaxID=768533 RepID=A0ABW5DDY9_9HYPH|nr:NUDIX domain-containing protein [bacterium SGD-2]
MADIHAVSIVVFQNGRFLLVRRGHPPAEGLYAFPGGRVEPGEDDETAARRELMEETNLAASHLTAFDRMTLEADDGRRYSLAVYRAAGVAGSLIARDDAAAAGWFTLDEMSGLPVTESTLSVAARIAAADHGDSVLRASGADAIPDASKNGGGTDG